eukprot:gene17715-23307_t
MVNNQIQKIYIAKPGDQVVGVIDDRGGDYYKVNISNGMVAILNRLSFDGATKRNKPELKKGDVIYARVLNSSPNIDTELTCTSASDSRKEWSSGETLYGELPEGLILKISTEYAYRLLQLDNKLLNHLAKYYAYEVAVGVNGVVWFKSDSISHTIIIRNAIINGEAIEDNQIASYIDKLIKKANSMNYLK